MAQMNASVAGEVTSNVASEVASLKSDVSAEVASLKSEMASEVASLNSEVASLKSDVSAEVASLKSEVASLKMDLASDTTQQSDVGSLTSGIGRLKSGTELVQFVYFRQIWHLKLAVNTVFPLIVAPL